MLTKVKKVGARRVILVLLMISIFVSDLDNTYAYWVEQIAGADTSQQVTFGIGYWESVLYPEWSGDVYYSRGEIVSYNDRYYEARRDNQGWEPGYGWFWWYFWREVSV